jgi:hypothetical protein
MALQEFDFPYHSFETVNPESGFRGQFGGSYTFSSKPVAPDQRLFKLGFEGMRWFTDNTGVLDVSASVETNMLRMVRFYEEHKLHKSFNYNHPIYGMLVVKFNKPLPEPKVIKASNGLLTSFEVELIEIP